MPTSIVPVRVVRGWVPVAGATVQGEVRGAVPGSRALSTAEADAEGNAILSFDVQAGTPVETHIITGRGREWSGILSTKALPVAPEDVVEISLGLPWEAIGLGAAALSLYGLSLFWPETP
jgi:hypothetical protein